MIKKISMFIFWILKKATKTTTVSNFLFYMLIIGIAITTFQSVFQAERIKMLQQTNEHMNDIAEKRLALINQLDTKIDSLKKTINEQNEISRKQLDFERELREKQNAQISTIKTLLQGNQCADSDFPYPLLDQLHYTDEKKE